MLSISSLGRNLWQSGGYGEVEEEFPDRGMDAGGVRASRRREGGGESRVRASCAGPLHRPDPTIRPPLGVVLYARKGRRRNYVSVYREILATVFPDPNTMVTAADLGEGNHPIGADS